MSETPLFVRATEIRADAVRHLTALAGDASMCAIGRSGRSFPAAKYHEGRQAAASQVRRAVRSGAPRSGAPRSGTPQWADDVPVTEPQVLADVRGQWQQTLESAQSKGPDWVAYATGGLDALSDITDASAER